jgi:predicted PP-loop superfamily ATPase
MKMDELKRLKELKQENARLKKLLPTRALRLTSLKMFLKKEAADWPALAVARKSGAMPAWWYWHWW